MSRRIQWEGLRFGRLTVLRPDPVKARKVVCLCDCGKTTSVFKTNLKSGNTKSCGCYKSEVVSALGKRVGPALQEKLRPLRELNKRFNTNFGVIESKTLRSNNTTGHTGVYYYPSLGKYMAGIGIQRQYKYLGMYSQYQDAVDARERAEKEYFEPVIEAKNEYLEEKKTQERAQSEYEKWKRLASYMR